MLELMFSVSLVARSQYFQYVDRARTQTAINEIAALQVDIERFRSRNLTGVPESLAGIGRAQMLDPWNRPYRYIRLADPQALAAAREHRRLILLNRYYDLFSTGKDRVFMPQVSQRKSLGDIIRARVGAFIGLGSEL